MREEAEARVSLHELQRSAGASARHAELHVPPAPTMPRFHAAEADAQGPEPVEARAEGALQAGRG